MSSPATSCARRCVDTASSYCSRQRALTIASRKLRLPSCTVCQAGRGKEPMIDVGSRTPAEALYIASLPLADILRIIGNPRRLAELGGRRRTVAEKLDIGRDLLEQHIGTDLIAAATGRRRPQQRRHLGRQHHLADKRLPIEPLRVERQRIVGS